MKKLMTLLLTVAFGVAIVTPAYSQAAGPQGGKAKSKPGQQQGQRQGGGGMMRGQRLAQMEAKIFDQIGVSADQKTKIAALNKDQQTKREALMKKYNVAAPKPGERPAQGQRPQWDPKMMEEMRAMQKGRQDGLKKILTKAQFTKYEELVKAERAKMRGPGGPGGAAGRPGGGGIKANGGKPGI